MKIATVRFRGQAVASALLAAVLSATTVPGLRAQSPAPAAAADSSVTKLSDADLDELLGPIALYPDALIGIILPASTVPSDITLAARYVEKNGDTEVDSQPWDDSVKALARYPDVLSWMDQNLEWTNSLGEAFVEQPADVMNAVQRLRGTAKEKGNLVNTPQQTVVVEKETIRIVPTDPEVIYVPQYDPQVVYVQTYQPDYTPLITFGAGFVAGAWLSYDFDWGRRGFYYGPGCGWNNRDRWWGGRGYREGSVNVNNSVTNITNITNNNTNINQWRPNPNSVRRFEQRQRKNLGNARIAQARQNALRNGNAGKVRPAAAVPRPNRLNVAKGNANRPKGPNAGQANNRPGAKPGQGPNAVQPNRPSKPGQGPDGAQANRPGKPGQGPNAGQANRPGARPGQGPNANAGNQRPDGSPQRNPGRVKAPTQAPSVAGERPAKNRPSANRPGENPKKSPSSTGAGERPANKRPTNAPRVDGDGPRATKPSASRNDASTNRPRKAPEANAPQRRPSASRPDSPAPRQASTQQSKPRPAVERPRSQPKQQTRSEARPQPQRRSEARPQQSQQQRRPEARPQQSQQRRPEARPQQAPKHQQPAAKQGGGGGNRGEGKKKKKDD